MKYKVCISNPEDHFVGLNLNIPVQGRSKIKLQLPAWRPGRYELGNFAKNIRKFQVFDSAGKPVSFKKINKDLWEIHTQDLETILVDYEYYANQPDAGACYVSEDLLYINPVHCFMYVADEMHLPIALELDVPAHWQIACQLKQNGHKMYAGNFDELADSPFFASASLIHHDFEFHQSNIHFWFQGATCPNLEQLEHDTKMYAEEQIQIFGELPLENYHFLYLLLPEKFRHGVEHTCSTVISMGPVEEFVKQEFYDDFLAISSHEFFHLWNVKRMRPEEMLPYDFTRENYSELGYIYEGITTYYGDLTLFRSGVWDFETYKKSLEGDLTKHINNPGRFNYSLAESSFDTWLDGYVPGVKGRKVSIYMEGLVAAFIADIYIMGATRGRYRLDQVLRNLYRESFKKDKGYTRGLYKSLLEEVSGENFDAYFSQLIEGRGNWDELLINALKMIGLTLELTKDEQGLLALKIVKIDEPSEQQSQYFEFWAKSA